MDAVSPWRKTPFALLIVTLLIFGIYPSLLTDKIKPAAESILVMANGGIVVPAKSRIAAGSARVFEAKGAEAKAH